MSPIVQAALFGVFYFAIGIGALVLNTQMSCKKIDAAQASADALIMGLVMAAAYLGIPYMGFATKPVADLAKSAGMSAVIADVLSRGYVLMLFSWVVVSWMSFRTQAATCRPSNDERKKFRAELLAAVHKGT